MDWLVDTNIILRPADRLHPASSRARASMKVLFRRGHRLCVTRQTLLEAWVVATSPRDVNGFGYSAQHTVEGLSKVKRLFHILADTDDIYQVLGKNAYDARLAAAMQVHNVPNILTFNCGDFKRYSSVNAVHPDEVLAGNPL